MSTYWQGVANVKTYIKHLEDTSKTTKPYYNSLFLQFQHELREIDHYNKILTNDQYAKRQKRGLVNGVGYLANTLFGVLDERFANQYREDIEKIASNENHLQKLLKNQTLIIESEYNILKRHEDVMKQQLNYINDHIQNTSTQLHRVVLDTDNGLSVISSALTVNIILSNLRRMQQTLIDTITDIYHGHIDTHLILPEELHDQLNIISAQLQGDLMLPVERKNIKDLYKLLKTSARIVSNYLIIEVRIPLLSTDLFELNQIITLPIRRGSESQRIIPAFPYLAYNLNKDLAFLMSEHDFQMCLQISQTNTMLCSLNMPLYQLKLKQSLCDIKLLNAGRTTSTCDTIITPCEDSWIKLHQSNDWIFACCQECHVRIYCTAGMTITELKDNGIISIGQGCTLRSDSFSLYAHNNYLSRTNIRSNIEVPEVSILNTLINTSIPDKPPQYIGHNGTFWNELKAQIENIKLQSSDKLNVHDIHHYTALYVIISCFLILGVSAVIYKVRGSCCRMSEPGPVAAAELPPREQIEMQSYESVCDQSVVNVCDVNPLPKVRH